MSNPGELRVTAWSGDELVGPGRASGASGAAGGAGAAGTVASPVAPAVTAGTRPTNPYVPEHLATAGVSDPPAVPWTRS